LSVGYVSEAAEVAQIAKAARGAGSGGCSVLGLGSRLFGCLCGSGRARGASRLPRFAQVSEAAVLLLLLLLLGSGVLRDSLVERGCFGGLFADSGFGGSARQIGEAPIGRGASVGNGSRVGDGGGGASRNRGFANSFEGAGNIALFASGAASIALSLAACAACANSGASASSDTNTSISSSACTSSSAGASTTNTV
jgi:hypothetical protein